MKNRLGRLCWWVGSCAVAWAQPGVTTAQYDQQRTNANLQETHLTPARVGGGQFGLLFTRTVVGFSYALPLYVPNLEIPGRGRRNVLYVATTANRVYAFDADQPAESAPLWSMQLGTPRAGDEWTAPTMGILSTPVIDRATQTLYCVAAVDSGQKLLQIFALDLTTGALKFNSPGTLNFEFANLTRTDVPEGLQRTSLLLSGGRVYVAVAAVQEDVNVHDSQEGWVFAYNAADVTQRLAKYQVTPTGLKGGIWQAGRGLAADEAGNIYLATAGGTFDGAVNFGSSYLKLSSNLALLSFFTPSNFNALYLGNLDPSATGVLLIPGTNLALGGGKLGQLYTMNRTNLGGLETAGNPPVQSWDATNGCGLVDCAQTLSLAFFARPGAQRLYVADRADAIRSYAFDGAQFNPSAVSVSAVSSPLAAGLTVSSAPTGAGAIVWALTQNAGNGVNVNTQATAGVLRALNPDDLTQEYWNSESVNGQSAGDFVKFSSPVVANGRVYVPTRSDKVSVYGMTCAQPGAAGLRAQYGGFRFDRATNRFLQVVTLTNTGAEPLSGPFELTLSQLPAGVELVNRSGLTACSAPAGRPYLRLDNAPLWLMPQQSVSVQLQFTTPNAALLRYSGQVLQGSGGL